jgi:peptide/nickel transport system substrate-binding protein
MEFRVLGPVEVLQDGRELPLGGPKQRVLLALLLLRANETVSRDQLIDGLWGERPPPSAAHTLDSQVSRMRKTLGEGRLVTRTPGYLLRVEPGELDLDRFERLYRRGHEALIRGAATEAADALRSALALWRGPALVNVLYEPFGLSESERLEERRLLALEDRIKAELELGRSDELIPELEALVRDHPLRERLLGQLMLALYRSGRQAEALAALQAARHRLAEELGLEPGPHLRELERQILQHDPALAVPRARSRRDKPRGRPVAVGLGALAIAVAAVIGVVLGIGQTTASRTVLQNGNTLVSVDARSGRFGPGIALGGGTTAMKAAGGSVWLANPNDDTVSRVSASTATVVDRIPVEGGPGDLAVGGGSVWVASTLAGTVSRIDPPTGAITQTTHLGGNPSALAYGAGSLWIADSGAESLIRLDAATGKATQSVSLTVHPSAVALGAGAVWVASHDAGTVTEIDPTSGATLATVPVGQGPAALALGAGSVWVANELAGTVSRIDPRAPKVVATVVTGSGPSAVAFADGALWVANEFSGDVSRIDPRRDTVESVHVGGRPASLAAGKKAVWVARGALVQHRGGTLKLLATGRFVSLDPGFSFQAAPPQWLGLSNDTLVTYEHVSGPDGLHLVPDLAAALPAPTDAGRTYAFRLRPGIRYSDGRPLRARDFRRAFERLFAIQGSSVTDYANISGAQACLRFPRTCDLADGITVDDRDGIVVFHLAGPDPDFLFKLASVAAAPIPPGTSSHDAGRTPILGTGPYKIVRVANRQISFARNPYFHEWSHAAQPSGNPDRILWRIGRSPEAEVRAIEHGRADWMLDFVPVELRSEVQTQHAAQLHSDPVPETDFFILNTRRSPFNDVRVRRALNYALDRRVIAGTYGGPAAATPTCQLLPPGLRGYSRYCPYTSDPSPSGVWRAPDLAHARRLIAASGTKGASITVWGFTDDPTIRPSAVRDVASVLRRLGYRVRVHLRTHAQAFRHPGRVAGHQIGPAGWSAAFPSAGNFLSPWIPCNGFHNDHRFCDPRVDNKMRRATLRALTDLPGSARLWTRIDHELTDRAVWLPLVNPRIIDFISSRVRNYEFHPVWGFMADQVWLR